MDSAERYTGANGYPGKQIETLHLSSCQPTLKHH